MQDSKTKIKHKTDFNCRNPSFALYGDIERFGLRGFITVSTMSAKFLAETDIFIADNKYYSAPATNIFEFLADYYQNKIIGSLSEIETKILKEKGIFKTKKKRNNLYLNEGRSGEYFTYSVKPIFESITFLITTAEDSFKFYVNYGLIRNYLNKTFYFCFFPVGIRSDFGEFNHENIFDKCIVASRITFLDFLREKKEVVVVCGLPKSGKSSFANYLRSLGYSRQVKTPFAADLQDYINGGELKRSYVIDCPPTQELLQKNPRIIFIKPLYCSEIKLKKFAKQLIKSHYYIIGKGFPNSFGFKNINVEVPLGAELMEYYPPFCFKKSKFEKKITEYQRIMFYQLR